jgi:hypothetical protein
LLATQSTPAVEANWDAGLLRMEGESYPENTYDVYVNIVTWVDSYLIASNRPLRVELHLDYLNTSSIRAMIDIFDRLQVASEQAGNCRFTGCMTAAIRALRSWVRSLRKTIPSCSRSRLRPWLNRFDEPCPSVGAGR